MVSWVKVPCHWRVWYFDSCLKNCSAYTHFSFDSLQSHCFNVCHHASLTASTLHIKLELNRQLSMDLWIFPWEFLSSWNVVPRYMVHHHWPWQIMTYTEITEIERRQILSSLVHSSLIVHCSYNLKFLMLNVIGRIDSILPIIAVFLALPLLDHVDSTWQTLTPFPATTQYRIAVQ